VRPVGVVVSQVAVEDACEVVWVYEEKVIDTFSAGGATSTLREWVRVRGADRSSDDVGAHRVPDVVEEASELGVAIADEMTNKAPTSASSAARLRGCWVTQAPVGLVVMLQRCTRCDSIPMKNKMK
jgi:hypothetical protein